MFKKAPSLTDLIEEIETKTRACTSLRVECEDAQVRAADLSKRLGTMTGDLARANDEIRRLGKRGDEYKVANGILTSSLSGANDKIKRLERDRMCMPYGAAPLEPMASTLFGRSFDDWARIDHVMRASRARVQDVEYALIGKRFGPPADPARDLEVYDAVNEKRHLGTIIGGRERFGQYAGGPGAAFRVAQPLDAPTVCYRSGDKFDSWAKTYTYEFRIGFKPDGWDQKAVLLTAAPLSQLRKLPYFRLPGETAEQHYERNRGRV